MKNILVVLGGGRPNGNTKQLVDAFAKGAMDAGHNVEIVSLNKVDWKKLINLERIFTLVSDEIQRIHPLKPATAFWQKSVTT